MELKRLLSYTRQAVDDYGMIRDGDHIAIGISGGKDSLTLLYALCYMQRFYPQNFLLTAITVDLGYGDFNLSPIQDLCNRLGVAYHIVHTDIARIVLEEHRESSPCSLCAKMRKGALNNAAKELGCNKIAYAHHMDDIIETSFLSLIFEGRFYSFSPLTHLDRTGLTVIRPLMYIPEAKVKGFQNKQNLPVVKNPCPADGLTKRSYIKNLLRDINREHPGAKKRIFHAILYGNIPGWPDLKKESTNSTEEYHL